MRYLILVAMVACEEGPYDGGLADTGGTVAYTRPGHPPTPEAPPAVSYGRREWQAGSCQDVTPPDGSLVQLLACDDLGREGVVCRPDDEGRLSLVDGVARVLCAQDGEHDSYVLTWIAPG